MTEHEAAAVVFLDAEHASVSEATAPCRLPRDICRDPAGGMTPGRVLNTERTSLEASLWTATAHPALDRPALLPDIEADTVIACGDFQWLRRRVAPAATEAKYGLDLGKRMVAYSDAGTILAFAPSNCAASHATRGGSDGSDWRHTIGCVRHCWTPARVAGPRP